MTETDQFVICGTTILAAEIRQGRTRPPPGPDLITRSLYIEISQEFLGERANVNEPVNELVKRKLRERRFAIPPVGIFSGFTSTGMWLVQEYSSVALAQSPRAVMEKYFAKDLEVEYTEDSGGGVHQIAQGDAGAGSGSSRKESKSSHWLAHLQWMLLS